MRLFPRSVGDRNLCCNRNWKCVSCSRNGGGAYVCTFLVCQDHGYQLQKAISSELETALSIITTAYLRNEDIITSIEENVHYLNAPVKAVFENFISRIKLSNPDITAAILDMKTKIDNEVFAEWCDSLILCQSDRSLKSTLTPIVNKLSDMRVVNADLEYLITGPRKEFISMAFLVIGNVPLLYMLNKAWFNSLMNTVVGQIVLAISAVGIFISTAIVIKLTKPIEYKR